MFFELLSVLLIGPLKLVLEIIFMVANRFIYHPGLSILFLSCTVSILSLPLSQSSTVTRRTFSDAKVRFCNDQRKPNKLNDVLNGIFPLLPEILFFIAAYQLFSHLSMFEGISLGPIADLSMPDALLTIGTISVNLLPLLMALMNIVCCVLLLHGSPLKAKLQFHGRTLFFLIFLYTASSGLVLFWTFNSLFSLVKAIFSKFKHPHRLLSVLCGTAGAVVLFFSLFVYAAGSTKIRIALILLGCCLELPLLRPFLIRILPVSRKRSTLRPNSQLFFLCCLFLTVFIGALIPSTYIAASPQEFVNIYNFYNPLWYIAHSFCLAAGFFLIWMHMIYRLAQPKGKIFLEWFSFIMCACVMINYLFFGTNLGIISANLKYETDLYFSMREQLLNIAVLSAVALLLSFIFIHLQQPLPILMLILIIEFGGMSVFNAVKTFGPVSDLKIMAEESSEHFPEITLSKNGKNVVVIMLDRALGYLVPYLMDEKPELREQFSGFTHYNNTISFGMHTMYGAPPLTGGYEYTPVEMNKRDSELLREKHNEALKVMPVAFLNEGYRVTVCDPPLANYCDVPDLSIFDDYPEINRYITLGRFDSASQQLRLVNSLNRNFFCFSMMKSAPLLLQGVLYNEGLYNSSTISFDEQSSWQQTRFSRSVATGIDSLFLRAYSVLTNLPFMTRFTDDDTNTYLFFENDTPHTPTVLQKPDYVPATFVDNTQYDSEETLTRTLDGHTLHMESDEQIIHYHANMATFLQLGNWFDYLKENGVYDNTRIIIVSDHGRYVFHLDEISPGGEIEFPVMGDSLFPLLMVKDFDSTSYTTSYEFMTNADVPALAMKGLIADPKNPFTGNPINMDEKYAHDQFITLSFEFDVVDNTSNTHTPSMWASVSKDRWDPDNWTVYPEDIVLKKNSFDGLAAH